MDFLRIQTRPREPRRKGEVKRRRRGREKKERLMEELPEGRIKKESERRYA